MNLLFVNLSELRFTVETPEREPLGGAESCVCYLARELVRRGHNVSLIARLPEDMSGAAPREAVYQRSGVRHFPTTALRDEGFFADGKFDAVIAVNLPLAIPHLRASNAGAFLLLWDHVAPEQPAMKELSNPLVQKACDGIVYVSDWQRGVTEKAIGAAPPAAVIGNGLTPSFENMFASPAELRAAKQNRAAYTVVPMRGLPVLLKAAEGLDLGLDIFSSMRVYQIAEKNDPFAALYQEAAKNPRIAYHGSLGQKELAKALSAPAFFAYPATGPETFCIAALEALAAGMKVITAPEGALASTTQGFADLVEPSENPEIFARDFRTALSRNIAAFKAAPELWAEERFAQMQAINRACAWSVRADVWEKLLMTRRVA